MYDNSSQGCGHHLVRVTLRNPGFDSHPHAKNPNDSTVQQILFESLIPEDRLQFDAMSRGFLFRVHPIIRSRQLDGHIRKKDMRWRPVRRAAMLG